MDNSTHLGDEIEQRIVAHARDEAPLGREFLLAVLKLVPVSAENCKPHSGRAILPGRQASSRCGKHPESHSRGKLDADAIA